MSIANADDLDWRSDAACLQHVPEVFFAEGPGAQSREAKKVCASCPVITRATCLEVNMHEEFGVFGGMTPPERLRFRRQITKRAAA